MVILGDTDFNLPPKTAGGPRTIWSAGGLDLAICLCSPSHKGEPKDLSPFISRGTIREDHLAYAEIL